MRKESRCIRTAVCGSFRSRRNAFNRKERTRTQRNSLLIQGSLTLWFREESPRITRIHTNGESSLRIRVSSCNSWATDRGSAWQYGPQASRLASRRHDSTIATPASCSIIWSSPLWEKMAPAFNSPLSSATPSADSGTAGCPGPPAARFPQSQSRRRRGSALRAGWHN